MKQFLANSLALFMWFMFLSNMFLKEWWLAVITLTLAIWFTHYAIKTEKKFK